MKIESKLFDMIRVKPRRAPEPDPSELPGCEWEGCDRRGTHRAPKPARSIASGGRPFHLFCEEHVRHYNRAFNFFDGMNDSDVFAQMAKAAATGERPTWGMGVNKHGRSGPRPRTPFNRAERQKRYSDPLNIFARYARAQARGPVTERERNLLEVDRRALETLGLTGRRPADEIKRAYKTLVKIHHPDANGGDKASEDRLRAIIAAYTHLKQKGFV